jgi:hypothetical protein
VNDPIVCYTASLRGLMRPVYEALDGRQYVLDDDGEPVYGVWFIPRDEADLPFVVEARS